MLGKPLAHEVQGLLWLIAKDLEDVFDANLFGHWLSSLELFLGVTHSAAASQAELERPTREAESHANRCTSLAKYLARPQ